MEEEDTDLDDTIERDNSVVDEQAELNSLEDTPEKMAEHKLSSALIIGDKKK